MSLVFPQHHALQRRVRAAREAAHRPTEELLASALRAERADLALGPAEELPSGPSRRARLKRAGLERARAYERYSASFAQAELDAASGADVARLSRAAERQRAEAPPAPPVVVTVVTVVPVVPDEGTQPAGEIAADGVTAAHPDASPAPSPERTRESAAPSSTTGKQRHGERRGRR